ncbi:hypothetical protein FSP39_019798 [Pinctada imbricata]|uniref:Malic enzyme n=1 Tax=Pinctada imbricata TaxID=66713 RepID=A0AA89C7U3_PINIB|nr:hypothetical protein FSP39_019798 [Pinctada imbricata]
MAELYKTSASKKDLPIHMMARPRVRGVDLLRDPLLNKGMGFTVQERQILGVHGLIPPAVMTQSDQVMSSLQNFNGWTNDLDRYIFMMGLQDRNEKLFYKVVTENVEKMMPIIYTPTVGLACQKYGLTFRRPRGLYITIHDKGFIFDVLCNWPSDNIKAIVVTDGERILGLGDLGCYGMGIPVGKLALYTALAGVDPSQCLPIMLDVGTDNKTLLDDPLYIGLRQNRVRGKPYEEFVDEFMQAVVRRFGNQTLIQFEDFGNHNAFTLLEKYREKYCTFNDDIQGTAAVAVAGIFASLKITGKSLEQNKFVFLGAGEASIGIAKLLVMAMVGEGMTKTDAVRRIWMVDSRGLIVQNRPSGGVTGQKVTFAQDHAPIDKLAEIVKQIKPTAIIGASAVPGAFTEEILTMMGNNNERPIIFALSNPTSKAECTAEQAYKATKGRCVFASGSPFKPVELEGKTFVPGQGNNAYIFPGIALATILCDIRCITEDVFLESAKLLASMVDKSSLDKGLVYPPLSKIREVSTDLTEGLINYAYKNNLAYLYPEPPNVPAYIKAHQYNTDYQDFMPAMYNYPNGLGTPVQHGLSGLYAGNVQLS